VEYERIGTKVDGEWRQLNANMLQIENEYYSFIRPKQPTQPGERPVQALRARGVEYIEVRALDVSAYAPLGVHESQLRFIEAFLVYCLLMESSPLSEQEEQEIDVNQERVACRGRQPGLTLLRDGGSTTLKHWGREILSGMEEVCEFLDQNHDNKQKQEGLYRAALKEQWEKLEDPNKTPSARMLAEMRETGESFFDFASRLSDEHMQTHLDKPLPGALEKQLQKLAKDSLAEQKQREAADTVDLETYLRCYFTGTAKG